MNKKRIRVLLILCAAALLIGAAVYAVGGYGSQTDPLITKSYLDGVLRPELEEEMRQQLEGISAEAERARGEFVAVTLNPGKRLYCGVGTELLLRSGTVVALPDWESEVLADLTLGTNGEGGKALMENHLYVMLAPAGAVIAGDAGATLLVSGVYVLEEPPVETEPPQMTEEPQATEEPQETGEPQTTGEPQETEEPQTTEEPQETEEPLATDSPRETEAPEETEQPTLP